MKLKGNDYDDIYNSYPIALAFCWNMDWNETALKATKRNGGDEMDRETVIKELEHVRQTDFDMSEPTKNAIDNVLELLKEQEAKTQGADSGMCEICSFYERAMSVKPHYNARANWYECGACKFSMTSGMHCKGILIPAYKVGFCAKCGKAVKWE